MNTDKEKGVTDQEFLGNKEKKEVAVAQTGAGTLTKSPAELIQMAVQGGADLDKLEKLLDIQLRWDAEQAKKAYHVAMSAFKANPPEITKDKQVSYKAGGGTTAYKHASLYNVTKSINEALSRHGLSASWQTAQNGAVSVTCKITHAQGHSETTTLSAQSDASGSKNAIQAIGSTITYLQRYTLLALTGLATHDQDDDGKGSEQAEAITEEETLNLQALIDETKPNMAKLLAHFQAESLDTIPANRYKEAVALLENRRKEQGGKK